MEKKLTLVYRYPKPVMDKSLKPDHTSMLLLSQGDTTVFTRIFTAFYKPLVLFAFSSVREKEAAEDIVQAFFCRLWEERQTLSGIKHPKSYFYQAVRNACLNYIRHRKVVSELPLAEEEDATILQTLVEEEIYLELIREIERLPSKCKQIMLLKLKGMDNTAIAAEQNISEETVRSQYRHGKDLLRKRLGSTMIALICFL